MTTEGRARSLANLRPFPPGESGNPVGKPKGTRNKLSQDFLNELQADFELHGRATIIRVREKYPDTYLKIVAHLMPTETNVRIVDDLSDAEISRRIEQLAAILGIAAGTPRTDGGEEAPDRAEQVIDLQPLSETEGLP